MAQEGADTHLGRQAGWDGLDASYPGSTIEATKGMPASRQGGLWVALDGPGVFQ
jgi:hypothetical protein